MGQDATDCAISEFEGVPGLNARFQKRLVKSAAVLATRPQGTLPHRFEWAELKGLYRLVHAVGDPDTLQQMHRQRTRERMAALHTPILIVHDTTQLDFSSHLAVVDQLGPIGDGAEYARGFLQHNSLAIDPTSHQLLGLIYQQTLLRIPREVDETRAARYRRGARESMLWIDGVKAVGRPETGQTWIHVGDRGADFIGFMLTARTQKSHFLVRLVQNRQLQVGEKRPDPDTAEYLIDTARTLAPTCTATVEITGRGGRPGRTATVKLAATHVRIRASKADPIWRSEPAIDLTVVRIWEDDPPEGVEPLEWILGTDLPDVSPEALFTYQHWYQWRWRTAEEYHKVQKTGCRIEDIRFETKTRLQTMIAIISVVAVRMLNLRWMRESCPDAPATTIASEEEIVAIQAARPGKPILTVKEFVNRVAGLGGFLGRKCDGCPGWQALWRGYQRLADILMGLHIATHPPNATPQIVGHR
jgi:hypothetical protein